MAALLDQRISVQTDNILRCGPHLVLSPECIPNFIFGPAFRFGRQLRAHRADMGQRGLHERVPNSCTFHPHPILVSFVIRFASSFARPHSFQSEQLRLS